MSAGNNLINFVSGRGGAAGVPVAGVTQGHLAGLYGSWLWAGFQSGARLGPVPAPTNQFFM